MGQQLICLYTISISVVILVTFIIFRYQYYVNLLQLTLKLNANDNLYTSGKFESMITDILLVIIHPNILTHGLKLQSYNYESELRTSYALNDVLTCISLIRIFPLLMWVILMSSYYSNRSHHLCQIHGFEVNSMFVIRALLKTNPMMVISIAMIISILVFAYAIRICERPLTDILNDQNYGHVSAAIWNAVVTMTTVGYGDMYPRTIPGRVLVFLLCLWGVFNVSLMVVTITNWVTLGSLEVKSMNMFLKLQTQSELESLASSVISNFFRFRLRIYGDSF